MVEGFRFWLLGFVVAALDPGDMNISSQNSATSTLNL
jgi:hypothetical protein